MKSSSPDFEEFREYAGTEASALADRLAEAAHAHAQALLRCAQDQHQAALETARAHLDQHTRENQQLAGALQEARAKSAGVEAELKSERDRTQAALSQLASEQSEAARVTGDFQNTLDELRLEHASTIRQQALACTALPLDELLTVFNGLAKAATLSDVLTTLVTALSREFSRVAVFRVESNRLEGVQQTGFQFESDISKIAIPLTVDSLLTRAVSSRRIEGFMTRPQSQPDSVPFGGAPGCAFALPIEVQGETVAVIYADDSEQMEFAFVAPELLAKFAELLWRHARLVLLRISADQRALAELREYATMLMNEVEYTYTADVDAGKPDIECQNHLKEALECTRRVYAQRIAREGPAAALLLEERLAAMARARIETPFGRDLAAIVRSPGQAPVGGPASAAQAPRPSRVGAGSGSPAVSHQEHGGPAA